MVANLLRKLATTDWYYLLRHLTLLFDYQACLAVVSYLNNVMDKIHGGLEGDNLHAVTLELAVRLHRVIYEHLHNYQFNSAGELT